MQNFLIVKLGAIGDTVMALPLANAIKSEHPNSKITWVCGEVVEPLLRAVKVIDELVVVNDKKLLTGNFSEKISEIVLCNRKVALKKYNCVLTLYRDKRYKLLTLFTRAETKKSFSGKRPEALIPGRYHGTEFIRLWKNIDSSELADFGYPEIILPELPSELKQLKENGKDKIVLVPGGAKNLLNTDDLRRWETENYISVARYFIDLGFEVIITGSASDEWVTNFFASVPVVNLVGKTSLTELLHVLSFSKLLIAHDTGTLYLSKLTGTPSIGLFGPVNPKERTGTKDSVSVIWGGKNLACSPCYDGKTFAPCKNNICMKNISVDEVKELARLLLEREKNAN